MKHHYLVIGAGIVGAACSLELIRRRPGARILLVEKEPQPARHQTGHNSGVVHAGVYYEPGSLKARFCREGVAATRTFCRENGLPYRTTGKLIVASNERELPRFHALYARCRENGLDPRLLNAGELADIEPRVRGTASFLVAESAVTDYPAVSTAMISEFRRRGGTTLFGETVRSIDESDSGVAVSTDRANHCAERVVVCGGLMADRLARMQGLDITFRTVPFRGEYFCLRPERGPFVKHLVYPVPDPALPFLGVHLTPTVDGRITVGPNAVQAWKREGYEKGSFSLRDTAGMLAFPGWWKLGARHLGYGVKEAWRAAWKRAYLGQVRNYCPDLTLEDLLPHPAGVRAQAVARDGSMIHDFMLERTPRSLHVCNAPSPAATSAIPISRHVCDTLLDSG